MKVKALSQGFYKGRHIDPGTIFDIDPKDFLDGNTSKFGWMEKVEDLPKKGFFS